MNSKIKDFEDALYIGSKKTFSNIVNNFSASKIYCLALYTSGELNYIQTTFSTFKGLREVAQKYQQHECYSQKSLAQLECDLKWSPCDSPHHSDLSLEENMDVANEIVYQLAEDAFELFCSDRKKDSEALRAEIENSILRVLQKLDREHVFGYEELREGIVVNLLKGDQSNAERLRFAKQLNPSSVFQKFAAELGAET